MQLFIILILPALLLGILIDIRALAGVQIKSAVKRVRRRAFAIRLSIHRAALRLVSGAALIIRRMAAAVRGAIEGWRGVL